MTSPQYGLPLLRGGMDYFGWLADELEALLSSLNDPLLSPDAEETRRELQRAINAACRTSRQRRLRFEAMVRKRAA